MVMCIKSLLTGLVALAFAVIATPALAATCGSATSAGTAPPGWETYCWLDFSTYNDATARSAAGQTFAFALSDGSVFNVTMKATSTAATAVNAVVAPSWTGAAVGNTAFLGIPGKPILYTANNASTVTLSLTNMSITPPAGSPAVTQYMIVAADAESTNNGESLSFVTNGSNWVTLDTVPPITGNAYPTVNNTGTTVTETGVAGTVGGFIFGTKTPTTVTGTLVAGGLQGAMFAVRFASLRLNKTIVSGRIAAADQFTYSVSSTTTGTVFATKTTSGAGLTGFTDAVAIMASGLPLTLSEAMAAGSVSALANYSSRLTCTNATAGSPTPLPANVATTSYAFGSLAYGDAVTCIYSNTPFPRLTLTKALGGTRVFAADQFTVTIKNGATTTASATTTGAGSAVSTGTTGAVLVTPATAYTLDEAAAGTTVLSYYTSGMACTNSYGASATVLPATSGGAVTPALGDNISCTITNTPKPSVANLTMTKTSAIISDPVNGAANPKLIPGAIVRYTVTVTNTGTGPVDASTVVITDPLPAGLNASVAGTAVTFTDGTPASGLTYTYGTNVTWTKAAGGGAPYTYTPAPDANGFDALVTGIRIAPTGALAATSPSGQPSFTIQFTAKIR
ncbi:MAG: DUF11 domain-containing protein [Sphingomonadaceae bacterium]|nr:DUF11 domain-containing protein [Sphingomonadaceae bacterium]